jgi:hypothetical protein
MSIVIYYRKDDVKVLRKIRKAILSRVSERALLRHFPRIIRGSIDFVLDTPFTGRTGVSQLDSVEKGFIGLKIEHRLRHLLGVSKGRHDLVVAGMDVDVKNTIGNSWMIGPEIYRHNVPCILTKVDDADRRCSLGLIVARKKYLGAENRDRKRSILSSCFENIVWVLDGVTYPAFKTIS